MKIRLMLFLSLFNIFDSFSQISVPFPEIIEMKKSISIPIIGYDRDYKGYRHLGTGFIIDLENSDTTKQCYSIVTCEHVINVKDSVTRKTIRTIDKLFANLNLDDGSIITVPLTVMNYSVRYDLAVLEINWDSLNRTTQKLNFKLSVVGINSIDTTNEIREGETLLYIGYPLSLGVGKKSHPISRQGFVAQNIKDSSKFLMDGFVQGGYSGSPVYRIFERKGEKKWVFKVVGIVQAYPNESKKIKSKESQEMSVVLNPGFTIVGKLNTLVRLLKLIQCE
jgi:hypothetical protein